MITSRMDQSPETSPSTAVVVVVAEEDMEAEGSITSEEELDLLLFTKEEEEFMVVPTLEDSPIRLEDLLSEATFNGLTVDILQNPSGVFVVDVDPTSSNHNSIGNAICNDAGNNVESQNFVQYAINQQQQQQQVQYYQQQQQFPYDASNNKPFNNAQVTVMETGYIPPAVASQLPQAKYSELADPTANWVAQTTDVTLLERLVSESERFGSVDDILDIEEAAMQPIVAGAGHPTAQQTSSSLSVVLDKKQILEEIYREAEEISSRRESPAAFTPESHHGGYSLDDVSGDLWERTDSNSSSSSSSSFNSTTCDATDHSMDSYQPSFATSSSSAAVAAAVNFAECKNFDHCFVGGGVANKKRQQKKSASTTTAKKTKTRKLEDQYAATFKALTMELVAEAGEEVKRQKVPAPKREVAKAKKRHQNREAALRYRLKKRAERAATGEELGALLERNEFLKTQKSNLASEIAYLKGFLSEVHRLKKIRS